MYSPWAASMPWFMARLMPPPTSRSTRLLPGLSLRYAAIMSRVPSVEPPSTKMCSKSWQVCDWTEARVSASVAALFQVHVTIEKVGLLCIQLQ